MHLFILQLKFVDVQNFILQIFMKSWLGQHIRVQVINKKSQSIIGVFPCFQLLPLLQRYIVVLLLIPCPLPFPRLVSLLFLQEIKISNFQHAISMRNRKIYLQVFMYDSHQPEDYGEGWLLSHCLPFWCL